jgi:hypothetical protein
VGRESTTVRRGQPTNARDKQHHEHNQYFINLIPLVDALVHHPENLLWLNILNICLRLVCDSCIVFPGEFVSFSYPSLCSYFSQRVPSVVHFVLERYGHGSDFSKLVSSEHEEQTEYIVGVSHIMLS